MARPKSKSELLNLSKKNMASLVTLIENLSLEEQNKGFAKETLNRNIRDVLMHLHHWHLMMLEWYTSRYERKKTKYASKRVYLENNTRA